MRHRPLISTALVLLAVTAGACSDSDDAGTGTTATGGTRTVEVAMEDIRFSPTELTVSTGETVKFVFTNRGAIAHDAFIGDAAAQADHEDEMASMSSTDMDGHGGHTDNAVTVEPGDTQTLTYTFDGAGTVEIGCHQPGHYAAGMKIGIDVS